MQMSLDELKEDAKLEAQSWEIDWEMLDSDIKYHEDFQKLLTWAEEFDVESAERLYNNLYNGLSPLDNVSPISLPQDEVDRYLDETAKTIREAVVLRDLNERYKLIMEITEGV